LSPSISGGYSQAESQPPKSLSFFYLNKCKIKFGFAAFNVKKSAEVPNPLEDKEIAYKYSL